MIFRNYNLNSVIDFRRSYWRRMCLTFTDFYSLNPYSTVYDLCTPAFRLIPGLIAPPLLVGI